MSGNNRSVKDLFKPLVNNTNGEKQTSAPVETPIEHLKNSFEVHAFRIRDRQQRYVKSKGAFKIKLINRGNTEVTVFENFILPSLASETFETGNHDLVFASDTPITYPVNRSVSENIDVQVVTYSKR